MKNTICLLLATFAGTLGMVMQPAHAQQAPSVVFKPTIVIPQPAYKRQAVNHMNAGRFQEAYDLLKANLEANRTDIDTRFMLAQCAGRYPSCWQDGYRHPLHVGPMRGAPRQE